MVHPARRKASYEDVLDTPEHVVAQVIAGTLHTQPRPAGPHAAVTSALSDELGPPFRRGRGGPGGWILLYEPELHLGSDILVPDLAGWRRERLSVVPNEPYFTLPPDWVCEVLSPSTAKLDRADKLPIYAREQVGFVWLVDPLARTLEILRRDGSSWLLAGVYGDAERIRAAPFDAIELDLSVLWSDLEPK